MSLDKSFLVKKIISADGPKPDEVNHNSSLEDWCVTCIEPEEESNRRRSVLERISNIVRVWIRNTMITEFGMPEAAAAQAEGRIFATGSYRYNVHTSGSDIDMVLIAPSRITREHFFNTLAPRFKSEPWVTQLHCITESRVPIIAMVCDGVDIDFSFGSIRQDRVPEVITDDLLQGLDEQSVRSCNAVRVAHNIMDLVPSKAVFRQTLRFVKAWGKWRHVYSNTFGFPSGIGWAILTAFVCQCYPRQNAAGMVARFFRTYHKWFHPDANLSGKENRAIYLTESMRGKTHLGRSWDPRESKSDAMALFPILTPALPYANACYNVTLTNLRQLCDEFKRGDDLISGSLALSPGEAKAEFGQYGIWSKLLEEAPFFGEYKYYMQMQVSCTDPEHYQEYVDGVESRMRILWSGNASSRGHTLEDCKQLRLHLNPRRYEDPEQGERLRAIKQRITAANAAVVAASAAAAAAGGGGAGCAVGAAGGGGGAGGNRGGRAGPGRRGSGQLPDSPSLLARPSTDIGKTPGVFTAHYFIGMTVDTAVSSGQVDLAPAIATFHSVVRQLRQYREGVTKLPLIRVVDKEGIPTFVKELVGYKDPEPAAAAGGASAADRSTTAESVANGSSSGGGGGAPSSSAATTAAGTARTTTATTATTTTTAATASTSTAATSSGSGGGIAVSSSDGAKRERADSGADAVAAKVAKAEAAPPPEEEDDDDDLEQALGLDF